jgi:hypothetical protein
MGETELLQTPKHESCDNLFGEFLCGSSFIKEQKTRQKSRKGVSLKYRSSAGNELLDNSHAAGKQNDHVTTVDQNKKLKNPIDCLLSWQSRMMSDSKKPSVRGTRKSILDCGVNTTGI